MDTVESKVSVKWVAGTMMAGMDSRQRTILIGAHSENGQDWLGLKASDLLLLAAASCSTYDVITILTKQREPVEDLDVVCTGSQLKEAPYQFTAIHLHYIIKGKVDSEKVARAIRLSEEKYCSVIASLRPTVDITSDYEIL